MQILTFSDAFAEEFLSASFTGGTTKPIPEPLWVSPLDDLLAEFSGVSRQVLSFGAAVTHNVTTNVDLVWAAMPAATVYYLGFWDAVSSGSLLFWGAVEDLFGSPVPFDVVSGEDLRIPIGNLTITI